MTSHRVILKRLMDAQGISQAEASRRMGWQSPRAIAHKLKGSRDWATGEIKKMCDVVGITLVQLAAQSDDLVLTRTGEALEVARIVDGLDEAKRKRATEFVKALQAE